MAITDRRGASLSAVDTPIAGDPNPGLAIKAPCRAATTAPIALSGLQTIDGVALNAGDRVLVWQQADQTINGIYNASTGNWTRAIDANSNSLWASGLQVMASAGALHARTIFECTSSDPIVLSTSAIVFVINNVPGTRQVNTTAPLAGGGALSADLTLSLSVNGITNALRAQMAAFTLKGNNTAATANEADLTAAQALAMLGLSGGYLNKLRNGAMDVWQRGTSSMTVTTAGAYTADGWIVLPAGASVAVAQAAGRQLTSNSLQVTGATGVTDVIAKQRIEGAVAAPLTSQTVTVQAQIFNNTGGSITPTLTVKHATAVDNWGATSTDVAAVNLQACASGAWTQVAYTFAASASAANGLEIGFDFGNNFSTSGKSIQITEVEIRATPGMAAGLSSAPPPIELRPVAAELPFCQRYLFYWTGPSGLRFVNGVADFSTELQTVIFAPAALRAAPAVTQSNMTVNGNNVTGITVNGVSGNVVSVAWTVASGLTAGTGYFMYGLSASQFVQISAEL